MRKPRGSFEERFWAKVARRDPDACWEWTGSVTTWGYGQLMRAGRGSGQALAHRASYEMLVGPIPAGLQLDHLCRNPACVNPKHLEPVTNRENTVRGVGFAAVNARKTHCNNGHAFDAQNTRIVTVPGRRFAARDCRACDRESHRRRYAAMDSKRLRAAMGGEE